MPEIETNMISRTFIHEKTRIQGEIESKEELRIAGYIEGNLRAEEAVYVEASGIVRAQINCKNIIVSGFVLGDIVASECVDVQAGGRILGNISTPRLLVSAGGALRGNIQMGEDLLEEQSENEQEQAEILSRIIPIKTNTNPIHATPLSARNNHSSTNSDRPMERTPERREQRESVRMNRKNQIK